MIYKVSFVVQGGGHPGTIQNMEKRPKEGDRVKLDNELYEIVEVLEIIPAKGDFGYLHATCRPVKE